MIAQDLERRSVRSVACRRRVAEAAGERLPCLLRSMATASRRAPLAAPCAMRSSGSLSPGVDLATTAEPEKVIALAERAGLKTVPTGIDHGTVTVIAEGKPFEVTTLRRDVETFGRHAKVAYTTSWEEDAKRRDFTLNALYADRDGNVFDPIGGYGDLQAGRGALHRRGRGAHQRRLFAHSPLLPLQRLLRQRRHG